MHRHFILPLVFFASVAFAQGVTISGRIVDSETLEPLPFAHVFIDQTTIGTVSDVNGEYALEHVYEGKYKLVFSYVGYELYFSEVTVAEQDLRVSARLLPDKKLLLAVEVKGTKDEVWEKQLKQFTKVFFGDNTLAKECTILNPWVLEFNYDRFDKVFKATATAPLLIENKALGYNIECTLQDFSFDKKEYRINGLYKFVEVNTLDAKEAQKWTRNRKHAYQSSLRFLFRSIADRHEAQNGFHLYMDKRPPNYFNSSAFFSTELGKNVFEFNMDDILTPTGQPGFYKIDIEGKIEVHHTTEYASAKAYRDVSCPVSWIECEKGSILFSKNGFILNNDQIVTSGEFNKNRVASMLPLNYSPGSLVVVNYLTKRRLAKRLQEKTHVVIDKGFYYPGEELWFRAFMNYANQSVRDSLSRVLHIELINPSRQIVKTKVVKTDSAWGSFLLPEESVPGIYHIRAYTNWMKNYGPEVIFYRPFILMHNNQCVISTVTPNESGGFILKAEKKILRTNEKINFSVLLDSSNQEYNSTATVSIVKAGHAAFPGEPDIRESLSFPEDMPASTLTDFIFSVENGIDITGRLFRPRKRYTSGQISAIQGQMDSLFVFKTDYKGSFKIEGLNFYDTTRFSFQARDKRGRIFGQTELIPYRAPEVAVRTGSIRISRFDTIALQAPVFLMRKAQVDSIKILKQSTGTQKPSNSVGFNLVITGEQLETMSGNQSIVSALQSRVPGFQVNLTTGQAYLRGGGGSSSESEVLFVVDGIPVFSQSNTPVVNVSPSARTNVQTSGPVDASTSNAGEANIQSSKSNNLSQSSAMETLNHIFVDQVSRVEVSTGMDPRYGSMGANGVISIYTKSVHGKNKEVKTFDEFVVNGFTRSETFVSFDSMANNFGGDYLSTIYWNPSVSISAHQATKILVQSPAKPGNYVMRVEGKSAEGRPLFGWIGFVVREP